MIYEYIHLNRNQHTREQGRIFNTLNEHVQILQCALVDG